MNPPELIYIGDPLCSWCWGFAPSLRKLRLSYPDRFRYVLMVGGLRTGASALRLDAHVRDYLKTAWQEVQRRSGQPFNHDFLRTAGFIYDTEPACRAVVAARILAPERTFDYNEALQEAFYHRSLDPTVKSTFLAVARELGFDVDEFETALSSVDVELETHVDFETARSLGVHGFPSLVVRTAASIEVVTRGWLAPETLVDELRPWLQ